MKELRFRSRGAFLLDTLAAPGAFYVYPEGLTISTKPRLPSCDAPNHWQAGPFFVRRKAYT